jgi:hypothetical protein
MKEELEKGIDPYDRRVGMLSAWSVVFVDPFEIVEEGCI